MKKVVLLFTLGVIAPSLVLAWLAARSLRDQQFILEHQQSVIYQGIADSVARETQDFLSEQLSSFGVQVEMLLLTQDASELARNFDDRIRTNWPLARVGFAVTVDGAILSPSLNGRTEAREFFAANGNFLGNRESAEVYLNNRGNYNQFVGNALQNRASNFSENWTNNPQIAAQVQRALNTKTLEARNVTPVQQNTLFDARQFPADAGTNSSRLNIAEAEFRQLVGDAMQGSVARFVNNQLALLCWYRSPHASNVVFGAQLALPRLVDALRGALDELNPTLHDGVCVAVLDDTAKPVALSRSGFRANWKRPFAASEIGETLPHWEAAVYLLHPEKMNQAARSLRLTIGLLIVVLLLAIGIGTFLIFRDLNRQLQLARQKTDFVSNVSHELKTPLTSIRMFSEMLADGRVADPVKQRSYSSIISAEAGRLTRLINNVLDFSRIERGEKKYNFQRSDLVDVVRETTATLRPHLEQQGFRFECDLPAEPLWIRGDRDALAQLLVNLLSNAEKYSDATKEICVQLRGCETPIPHVEVDVLDRGFGVPRGCEEKIFEQFYRAHDSLSSGIQGSGLGLTLARQIARAHGGTVTYEAREGGGSCFTLRVPRSSASNENENPGR